MIRRAPRSRLFAISLAMSFGALLGAGAQRMLSPAQAKETSPAPSLGVFKEALGLLESRYIRPLDRKALLEAAISGMTSILDPHTTYLDPGEAKMLREEIDGAFGGVGLVVQWDPQWLDAKGAPLQEPPKTPELRASTPHRIRLRVKRVVPGSPADQAKVQVDDAIVEIQGKAVAQFPHLGAAVMQMRGPIGTLVSFRIQRGDQELEVKVKRGRVLTSPVDVKALGDGVLHVRLTEFSSGVTEHLRKQLKQHPQSKLVLDLRDNGGGLLDEAVGMADLFIDRGVLVRTRGRDRQELEVRRAHRRGTLREVPIVVLINKASASASEILAGALQDHQRALVAGERSFGKGSVQIPFGLSDGGMLKTTIALYYTPQDRVIQARGIAPDLWVSAQAPTFVDSRPEIKSERDAPRHLKPPGAAGQPTGGDPTDGLATENLEGTTQVPAQHPSLRAATQDPQLQAAVAYLLAAERIGPTSR